MYFSDILKKINNFIFNVKNNNIDVILNNLEETLIKADVSIDTTLKIIYKVESYIKNNKNKLDNDIKLLVKDIIKNILCKGIVSNKLSIKKPYVIMIMGINGVGKTTTIGKLSHMFYNKHKKVIIGSTDTFRSGAIKQLYLWSQITKVDFMNCRFEDDPASVAYNTVKFAINNNYDYAIIDTSGRLHNKKFLMQELSKIHRSVNKLLVNNSSDNILIIDSNTGQNALNQVKEFSNIININSIILTKIDGTPKGGIIISIVDKFNIPISYICNGESLNDINIFDHQSFINEFI